MNLSCFCFTMTLLLVISISHPAIVEAVPITLPLRRQKPVFIPGKLTLPSQSHFFRHHQQLRNTIPMNGGVVNFGVFFLELSVGQPGQVFNVIVDTGSSNTAIPSLGCQTCDGAPIYYNVSASMTAQSLSCQHYFCQTCQAVDVLALQDGWMRQKIDDDVVEVMKKRKEGEGGNEKKYSFSYNIPDCKYGAATCTPQNQCQFSISYGGASAGVAGTIVTDQVCFQEAVRRGGKRGVCSSNNVFIDQILAAFPAGAMNTGIMGLAYPKNSCNPTCQPTILDAFVDSGMLLPSEDKFGMCLTATQGGKLDLGSFDSSRYDGTLQYTPVVKQHNYNVHVLDILVNGVSIGLPDFFYQIRNDATGSFVDSACTFLMLNPTIFSTLAAIMTTNYSHVPFVHEFFTLGLPCIQENNASSHPVARQYPRIDFLMKKENSTLADFHIGMDGENYIMNGTEKGQKCLGLMSVAGIGVVLGEVVMQNYYVAFDRRGRRVGFAEVKSC